MIADATSSTASAQRRASASARSAMSFEGCVRTAAIQQPPKNRLHLRRVHHLHAAEEGGIHIIVLVDHRGKHADVALERLNFLLAEARCRRVWTCPRLDGRRQLRKAGNQVAVLLRRCTRTRCRDGKADAAAARATGMGAVAHAAYGAARHVAAGLLRGVVELWLGAVASAFKGLT